MPRLHVCSLALIAETVSRTGARSLVTLLSPGTEVERPAGSRRSGISISPSPTSSSRCRARCCRTRAHLEELLGFVRGWDRAAPMLIHCFAGVSRSTAAAYIAACALAPDRDEFAIARALRAASPTASPNARLVALADNALGRRRSHERSDRRNRPRQGMFRGDAVRAGAGLRARGRQSFTAFAIASCSASVGEPKKAGSLSLPPSAP